MKYQGLKLKLKLIQKQPPVALGLLFVISKTLISSTFYEKNSQQSATLYLTLYLTLTIDKYHQIERINL